MRFNRKCLKRFKLQFKSSVQLFDYVIVNVIKFYFTTLFTNQPFAAITRLKMDSRYFDSNTFKKFKTFTKSRLPQRFGRLLTFNVIRSLLIHARLFGKKSRIILCSNQKVNYWMKLGSHKGSILPNYSYALSDLLNYRQDLGTILHIIQ